jgi:alpha 1,2-mannosyltransferase
MLQHDAAGRPIFVHMNLLKQIPSGISRGTTFKRTRSIKLITDVAENRERREDLVDWGVEADMLANADTDGTAIMPAPEVVRRRAALERGLRPFLHGGSVSAVCVDIGWEDPRSDDDVETEALRYFAKHPEEEKQGGDNNLQDGLGFTEAMDGMRVKWDNPVETLQWNDDPRLRDFEDRFYNGGGRTTGQGF